MCRPFAASWDPTIPGAKCLSLRACYTYGSVPNIVTDVVMLLLPMPVRVDLFDLAVPIFSFEWKQLYQYEKHDSQRSRGGTLSGLCMHHHV
ncbi:hypothetical protein N7540_009382 [Penicillium herquei]|nr:hypothetical protein N7540_009382 [Penicillium herquei]